MFPSDLACAWKIKGSLKRGSQINIKSIGSLTNRVTRVALQMYKFCILDSSQSLMAPHTELYTTLIYSQPVNKKVDNREISALLFTPWRQDHNTQSSLNTSSWPFSHSLLEILCWFSYIRFCDSYYCHLANKDPVSLLCQEFDQGSQMEGSSWGSLAAFSKWLGWTAQEAFVDMFSVQILPSVASFSTCCLKILKSSLVQCRLQLLAIYVSGRQSVMQLL